LTNVQDDLYEIFNHGTYGLGKYSGSPTKCQVLGVAGDIGGVHGVLELVHDTKRALVIHPCKYENERVDDMYFENRVYTMKITIISHSRTDLEDIYVDAKKVIDKYNQAPWAANSTTYSAAKMVHGEDTTEAWSKTYYLDAWVQLMMLFKDVDVTLA
jgi:hypothetical protein